MRIADKIENQGGHGAIPLNRVRRKIRKVFSKKVARGIPFDWSKGFDVRDQIGPIAIKDQGSSSSCGGQAGAYFLEIQRRLRGISEGAISAKSLYAPMHAVGGGMKVTSLETQIGAHGGNLEVTVPSYDHFGRPLIEPLMEETTWLTSEASSDALKRAGYVPYDIGTDIDDVATNIALYGAAIVEIEGQNNGTWVGLYPEHPQKENPNPPWFHFMCAIGAKMVGDKKYIIFLQSEGPTWGDNGVQYISEDYFKSGFVIEVFTFISDLIAIPSPSNDSVWASVARWFRSFWSNGGLIAKPVTS